MHYKRIAVKCGTSYHWPNLARNMHFLPRDHVENRRQFLSDYDHFLQWKTRAAVTNC